MPSYEASGTRWRGNGRADDFDAMRDLLVELCPDGLTTEDERRRHEAERVLSDEPVTSTSA